jgi:hypothetical protein
LNDLDDGKGQDRKHTPPAATPAAEDKNKKGAVAVSINFLDKIFSPSPFMDM